MTPFAAILRDAVEGTPQAIGGSFAASDGEMVDSFATIDAHEWAVLTALYGVVMAQLNSAFGTWHYGGTEYFIVRHEKFEIVAHAVDAGYFVLLAIEQPANLARALDSLRHAAKLLRKEMA